MIRNCLKILTILILPVWLVGQTVVGEWDSYTSLLTIRDILIQNDRIYGASSGGLVVFDLAQEKFDVYGLPDGLSKVDVACIAKDNHGKIWLGMSSPDGAINIWNPETKTVEKIFDETILREKLTSVSSIVFYEDQAFVAYQQNVDWGVLHFKQKGDSYEYKDFYHNFPVEISSINALNVINDSLWVSTSSGLIYTALNHTDFKPDTVWKKVPFYGSSNVTNAVVCEGKIVADYGSIIYRVADQTVVNNTLNRTIRSLTVDSKGRLIASTSAGVFRLNSDQSWTQISSDEVLKTIAGDGEILWGGTLAKGLWYSDANTGRYFTPNTLLDNIYTTLFVDDDGQLIAGTNNGISFHTDKGWYNIRKEYYGVKIHDHLEDNWNYFVADTIAYTLSGRIYTLLKRKRDGDFFASLYGAYLSAERGGGLLRFNLNDLANYTVYDTTNGKLAASEGRGGNDSYLGIACLAFDKSENLWIANQYAQNDSVVAVLAPDDQWYHFSIAESHNYLSYHITAIEFDSEGRVWFGALVHSSVVAPSAGGIIVLDYNGTLGDKSDDKWYWISTSDGLANNSIFELRFDHEGELWIMNAGGIQRATVASNFPTAYFSWIEPAVLTSIPFAKECRIRVDGVNNKWIATVGSGVKVYTHDGVWLNDVEGFTTNNSGILDNTILDIAFDSPKGLAYLATTKGISIYKSPYAACGNKYKELKIFPSPYKIPSAEPMVIDELLQNSEVKIMTLDGTVVRKLTTSNGNVYGEQAFWDGRNEKGRLVSSGVYLCLAFTPDGDATIAKFAVIRK
ncbi:MAG: hypothetical protein COT43_08725 [Candidatus Marinimicrobia bacterium CG08_land_8_20_14_0_20_45_22]|nr:MAG: hypothetical protein COT43_08725 [Candidatus Marinimicrobia bacterium CG08_land_8_20_14_0_20_45_22]